MPFLQKILPVIAVACAVASCSPIVDTRGHSAEEDHFSQIVVGQTSSDDVRALLGSPSAESNFGDKTWYYIREKKERRGMGKSKVVDQHVTAIHFDEADTVAEVTETKKDEGKAVEYVEKTTPAEGRTLGVMEQLLGNWGKFSTPGREIDPRGMR